jgi:hypothetical protein
MSIRWKWGFFRACIVFAVLWIAAAAWIQISPPEPTDDDLRLAHVFDENKLAIFKTVACDFYIAITIKTSATTGLPFFFCPG